MGELKKIVAQGEVNAPLKCTITVDAIAKKHVENLSDHIYKYKNCVEIPPLTFIDDTIGISSCGLDSALMTSQLNAQSNLKKLVYGSNKCHKMHIGKKNVLCTISTIDTWNQEKAGDTVKSVMEMIDVEGEKHELELVCSDTYLGDIIQNNGKNDKNINQ